MNAEIKMWTKQKKTIYIDYRVSTVYAHRHIAYILYVELNDVTMWAYALNRLTVIYVDVILFLSKTSDAHKNPNKNRTYVRGVPFNSWMPFLWCIVMPFQLTEMNIIIRHVNIFVQRSSVITHRRQKNHWTQTPDRRHRLKQMAIWQRMVFDILCWQNFTEYISVHSVIFQWVKKWMQQSRNCAQQTLSFSFFSLR